MTTPAAGPAVLGRGRRPGDVGLRLPHHLAEPDPPAAAPSVAALAAAVPPPLEPVAVASAALADRDDPLEFSGTVRLAVSPVAGLPPLPGTFAADCAVADGGSVRTTAVDVGFTGTSGTAMAGLTATVTLTAADGGPPPPGSAVFVESSAADVRWCQDGTVTPTVDGFETYAPGGAEATLTAYVVAPAAIPAADLVLRVSGLRDAAGSNATGPWDRVTADRGGCPDDPAALCAPLG